MVPLHDNDGNPFPLQTWTWWNYELGSLVKGFTEMGTATGRWNGYTDQNRVVVIIVASLGEVSAIRALISRARERFQQEAMYLDYHSVFFEEVR